MTSSRSARTRSRHRLKVVTRGSEGSEGWRGDGIVVITVTGRPQPSLRRLPESLAVRQRFREEHPLPGAGVAQARPTFRGWLSQGEHRRDSRVSVLWMHRQDPPEPAVQDEPSEGSQELAGKGRTARADASRPGLCPTVRTHPVGRSRRWNRGEKGTRTAGAETAGFSTLIQ